MTVPHELVSRYGLGGEANQAQGEEKSQGIGRIREIEA